VFQGVCGEPPIYILAVGNYLLVIQECITKYIAKLYPENMVLWGMLWFSNIK